MNDVLKFLKDNPVQYFATVGLDGKPKVRPFEFMLEKDGKLYFCTSNDKPVYAEMQANPWVELSTSNAEFQWVRVCGKAVFVEDIATKTEVLEQDEFVKSLYGDASSPVLAVFYLAEASAVIADFSGNPPKHYAL